MKNKLIRISKLTGIKFAEFKDGIPIHLTTGEVIVPENVYTPSWWLRKGKTNQDGIYRLIEYTCDGGGKDKDCRVGSPAQSCIDRGLVIIDCAKYKLEKPSALITLDQCLELMED